MGTGLLATPGAPSSLPNALAVSKAPRLACGGRVTAQASRQRQGPPADTPPRQTPAKSAPPPSQWQQVANNIVAKPRLQRLSTGDAVGCQESVQEQLDNAAIERRRAAWAEAKSTAVAILAETDDNSSSTSSPTASSKLQQLAGAHRPVGMVVGSAWLLSVAVQLTGAAALTPLWMPVVAGGILGGLATAAHDFIGVQRLWRSPPAPLRVLITGGTSGVGKALAREFLRCGDTVLITSRSEAGAQAAVQQLQEEVEPNARIMGAACNVSSPEAVEALMAEAEQLMGGTDVVINNAGYSGSFQSLQSQSSEQVQRVVQTNLLGSLLITRAAMRRMADQPGVGHIFNTEGAGSDGSPTPQYAAYGATKAAIAQLLKTLQHEAAGLANPVRIHDLSPGMVLTPLLLEGATPQSKQMFNILCEHPETVAAFLVPRLRSVVARGEAGTAIRFLTPTRALAKFLMAPLRAGKYFDREGRPVYASERERLLGAAQFKRTQRLQRAAARRSMPFQLVYSMCMALTFLLIVGDALAN